MFTKKKRYFIDANVFLYAAAESSPLKNSCLNVFSEMIKAEAIPVTNTLILEEAHYIFYRQTKNKTHSIKFLNEIQQGIGVIYPLTESMMCLAWELFREAEKPLSSIKDYYHAACMLSQGIDTIVSCDADFDSIKKVKRLDPTILF